MRCTRRHQGPPRRPHRVLVESDRIPLAELDNFLLDLDPCGTANDDVDLLLPLVLVTERDPEAGRELHQAQAECLAAERTTGETSLELCRHPEVRRLVLELPE